MTILVCFFVLIISYSIQDKVKMEVVAGSMRDAFGVAEQRRFAGDVKLDGTPEKRQPGNIVPSDTPAANGLEERMSAAPAAGDDGVRGAFDATNADQRRLVATKEAFENAILTHPLLKDAADSVKVTVEEDGLQIIMVETENAPMFALGSANPTPRARALLETLAPVLTPLPNRIVIDGHADAAGAGSYSPFELTAARANAAREILENAGFPKARIAAVTGRGAASPLTPEDPYAPVNRRIEVRLEKAAPLLPPERSL
jgi:chemotaxis protein MotB